jgi:hypothetical protein
MIAAAEKRGLNISRYFGYLGVGIAGWIYYIYERIGSKSKKNLLKPYGILFVIFVFLLFLAGAEAAYYKIDVGGDFRGDIETVN